MILLAAALVAAQAGAGPAVLIVKTSAGYQFAHFSSMQRCQAAKATIIAERQSKTDDMERRGYKVVLPAPFAAICVPG